MRFGPPGWIRTSSLGVRRAARFRTALRAGWGDRQESNLPDRGHNPVPEPLGHGRHRHRRDSRCCRETSRKSRTCSCCIMTSLKRWQGVRDSNPRMVESKSAALPAWRTPFWGMDVRGGFEPPRACAVSFADWCLRPLGHRTMDLVPADGLEPPNSCLQGSSCTS